MPQFLYHIQLALHTFSPFPLMYVKLPFRFLSSTIRNQSDIAYVLNIYTVDWKWIQILIQHINAISLEVSNGTRRGPVEHRSDVNRYLRRLKILKILFLHNLLLHLVKPSLFRKLSVRLSKSVFKERSFHFRQYGDLQSRSQGELLEHGEPLIGLLWDKCVFGRLPKRVADVRCPHLGLFCFETVIRFSQQYLPHLRVSHLPRFNASWQHVQAFMNKSQPSLSMLRAGGNGIILFCTLFVRKVVS